TDRQPQGAPARRALTRSRARRGAAHLRDPARAAPVRGHGPARRAGREPGRPRGHPGAVSPGGAVDSRGSACTLQPTGDRGRLLRPRAGSTGVNWINVIIQGLLLGGLYALFACGLSLLFGVMEVI